MSFESIIWRQYKQHDKVIFTFEMNIVMKLVAFQV